MGVLEDFVLSRQDSGILPDFRQPFTGQNLSRVVDVRGFQRYDPSNAQAQRQLQPAFDAIMAQGKGMADIFATPARSILGDQEAIAELRSRIIPDPNMTYESVISPLKKMKMEEAIKDMRITDPKIVSDLEAGGTEKLYRAMQVIDGKLYPPMSATLGGKLRNPTEIGVWERAMESPHLATEDGFFKLEKGNKKDIQARYNPYFHTSRTPLNDQFSEAYNRSNLVTVEVQVPKSELTSGYRAERAKDAVGEMNWHSGPVSSQLPPDRARKVVLSRFAKVNRIVPDSEVAQHVHALVNGLNIEFPANVITPSLKSELLKLGVKIKE